MRRRVLARPERARIVIVGCGFGDHVDLAERSLRAAGNRLPYDYLVLAA
jgi:hypothetical protein